MQIIRATELKNYSLTSGLEHALQKVPFQDEVFFAVREGEVSGIGVRWINSFHPTAKYVRLIGDFPVAYLTHHIVPQDKVIYACWEDDQVIPVLIEEGFQLFRKTYMKIFSIKCLLTQLEHVDVPSYVQSLQEVLNEEPEIFFTILKINYEATHLANPVVALTWKEWQGHLLIDSPDLTLSAISKGGYILLHSISTTDYEIGWLGGTDLQSLLKWQLTKLQQQGVKRIRIEADTTDWYAMALFSFFNFDKIKAWHAYMKRV